ncbi:MAG: 2-C-methyl-D-erythritol 4-phosphate cytidylyltransferase [Phycisphaerales bacterium]|nr:MAG: 2-C-methyl-D-erythritol 4-phosphate cytidylyltransferase [Phycisphaerales bacterium]
MKICVIIAAAGHSSRFASADLLAPRSKLDEDLGGRPLLQRTIELFNTDDRVASIVVAGPHDDEAFSAFKLRHGDKIALYGGVLCKGGKAHRYETVAAALEHVPADATHIAIHDAARPCTPPDLIDRVFEAAAIHPGAIPCVPVTDTLKRAGQPETVEAGHDPVAAILGQDKPNEVRFIEETLPRENIYAAQTPQIFRAELLKSAYAQPDLSSTDDAQLVERLGEKVAIVEGDPRNIKVTTPADIPLARALLGLKPPQERPTHKRF